VSAALLAAHARFHETACSVPRTPPRTLSTPTHSQATMDAGRRKRRATRAPSHLRRSGRSLLLKPEGEVRTRRHRRC
jgi:hypothetical protein